jgi:hypothetical protein
VTDDVVCCLSRGGGDKQVWSNGGMMIIGEKSKEFGEKCFFQCHIARREFYMKSAMNDPKASR